MAEPYNPEWARTLIDKATQAALDAGCAAIQQHLGVKHGDFASLHFSGEDSYKPIADTLAGYLWAEQAEELAREAIETEGAVVAGRAIDVADLEGDHWKVEHISHVNSGNDDVFKFLCEVKS